MTSDDLEYDLNRLVKSRQVQQCIIYASTTSGTYPSTFAIVQPKIVFINEMNDSINHCNPQKKFQNLIQFHIYRQYYYLDFFKNSLIFHLICGIF
jgi:hypothetical protein